MMTFFKKHARTLLFLIPGLTSWIFLLILCTTQLAAFSAQQETNRLIKEMIKQQELITNGDIKSKQIKGDV